jgi:hypothetical protein
MTIDITTLAPYTLRLLLASRAADRRDLLPKATRTLIWNALGRRDWAPTVAELPVPVEELQQWLGGLEEAARLWMEEVLQMQEETP